MFCADVTEMPVTALTGCQGRAFEAPMPTVSLVYAIADGMPLASHTSASVVPEAHPLVRVGRRALAGVPEEKAEQVRSEHGGQLPRRRDGSTSSVAGAPSAGRVLEADQQWYYLHFDRDGTYLFFGDTADAEARMPFEEEDGVLPDGIGIGKKWRF